MKTLSIEERKMLTPKKALEILLKGNERFYQNRPYEKDHRTLVSEFSTAQYPFAFVLSCMDSRVPVEIIFDQNLGDLFSVRVAGNILNEDIIASAEFAVEVVGVKLVMVLAHTNCGAVGGFFKKMETGYIKRLLKKLDSPYEKYKQEIMQDLNPVDALARYNAIEVACQLKEKSEIIKMAFQTEKIAMVSAIYNVEDGRVSLLSDV